jgi:hypothetical protein
MFCFCRKRMGADEVLSLLFWHVLRKRNGELTEQDGRKPLSVKGHRSSP